ncbi:MAG: respiratory nitrate reductase subunit gamma [Propionibacteriaceae bacterium]|jgi:nitrate reductase gamma subunit|nr:respiratory nitrate reductase subunit gamma [Propionibacteriaceae bacterium]
MNNFWFGIFPYIALSIFVVGHIWRYRHDKFGWGTHTSQLLEHRWLGLGSPLLHLGVLLVVLGHGLGLLIPASWTEAIGLSESAYHVLAVASGTVAGLLLAAGLVILVLRRVVFRARLRLVTSRSDYVLFPLLVLAVGFGLGATLAWNVFGAGFDYRETMSVWFRSVFVGAPQIELMAAVPWAYQVHAISGFLVFAVWPFTRLVHVWSIPLEYFVRPFVVYRRKRLPATVSSHE